jgi:pyridoxamine 5'-phosphate oxidase-like protein
VIRPLPTEIKHILDEGSFCYLAARTERGPHLTPLVYSVTASRLWITTSRRSVKARAWKRDPAVGGLVGGNDRLLVFRGTALTYDLLDPATWLSSALAGPTISLAAAVFARRNARFFAGYAVDAPAVPLAWSPPGRVFTEIRVDAAAIVGDGSGPRWGELGGPVRSRTSFRMPRGRRHPLAGIPPDVAERVGESGPATVAVDTRDGPVVLPARWCAGQAVVYAAMARTVLGLAGGGPGLSVALVADHASSWRARAMAGVMIKGAAGVHVLSRLRSGRRSAERLVERSGLDPSDAVLLAVLPGRVVWWRGWSSGTVAP